MHVKCGVWRSFRWHFSIGASGYIEAVDLITYYDRCIIMNYECNPKTTAKVFAVLSVFVAHKVLIMHRLRLHDRMILHIVWWECLPSRLLLCLPENMEKAESHTCSAAQFPLAILFRNCIMHFAISGKSSTLKHNTHIYTNASAADGGISIRFFRSCGKRRVEMKLFFFKQQQKVYSVLVGGGVLLHATVYRRFQTIRPEQTFATPQWPASIFYTLHMCAHTETTSIVYILELNAESEHNIYPFYFQHCKFQ